MPIGTGIVSTPVQTQPNKPAAKAEQRSVSSQSGAFSPRTNVALNNAVTDLSSILAKVLATRQNSINKVPPEVRKLIDELMQNAFSLEKSLLKGLGASLQNRRYALAQLTSFGHLLTDLGKLAAKDNFSQLPTSLKNLFAAYRAYAKESGQAFNGVDLLNFAFSSLNGEVPQDLPQGIKNLLPKKGQFTTDKGKEQAAAPPLGKELLAKELKEVIEQFLPDFEPPSAEKMPPKTAAPAPKNPVPEKDALQQQKAPGEAAKGAPLSSSEKSVRPEGQMASPQAAENPAQASMASPAPQKQIAENIAEAKDPAPAKAAQSEEIPVPENGPAGELAPAPQETAKTVVAPKDAPQNAPAAAAATKEKIGKLLTQGAPPSEEMPPPVAASNDERAMQALRDLSNIVKDLPSTKPEQRQILADFANSAAALKNGDLKQLDLILSSIRQNMPGMLYQAAAKRQLDFLPKLWTFMQLCDLSSLDTKQAAILQKAGESVEAFAKMAGRTYFADAATANNAAQRSLDFMLPLYVNPQTSYPAYVNIYNEDRHVKSGAEERTIKDTWLRVCCLTEHIGAVETVLHLYDGHNLSVRLMFSDEQAAVSFEEFLPQLRAYLFKEKFNLTDLRLAALD